MKDFGKRIKAFRLRQNLTQERLSELLGVSSQAVSKWENDVNCPDISLLPELSAVLGVTLDELFDTGVETHLYRIEKMLDAGKSLSDEDFHYAEAQLKAGCAGGEYRGRCLTMLADLYLTRSDKYKSLASELVKKALELDPWKHDNHAILCKAAGGVLQDWCEINHSELINYYREFTVKNPDHAPGYLWYLDNLIADGRLEEAREVLEKMRCVRDSYHYELYLGLIAEKAGDYPEAERCWNEMVNKYSDVWFAWSSRADTYVKRAEYETALHYYREAIARQTDRPRFTDNYLSIAQICELTGNLSGAVDAYEHVLEIMREDWCITEGESVDEYTEKINQLKQKL